MLRPENFPPKLTLWSGLMCWEMMKWLVLAVLSTLPSFSFCQHLHLVEKNNPSGSTELCSYINYIKLYQHTSYFLLTCWWGLQPCLKQDELRILYQMCFIPSPRKPKPGHSSLESAFIICTAFPWTHLQDRFSTCICNLNLSHPKHIVP